jgi:hypothetical protein
MAGSVGARLGRSADRFPCDTCVQDRKLRLAAGVRLSRLFGQLLGIRRGWGSGAGDGRHRSVDGGSGRRRPCPAIGGSLGWVSVVGMERLLTVEFGPSRSRRFGRALAEAHSGPGECSEAEPGRYRARFVLGCARSADGSPGAKRVGVPGLSAKMRARSSETVIALIAAQTGGGPLPRLALARIVAVSSSRWERVR